MSGDIDSKALTDAAEKLAKAVKHARLAYQFSPGSYTWTTLETCLAAAKAFDEHVNELAFRESAEWLRKFPRIAEGGDAE
jgi:hypothetical protein